VRVLLAQPYSQPSEERLKRSAPAFPVRLPPVPVSPPLVPDASSRRQVRQHPARQRRQATSI